MLANNPFAHNIRSMEQMNALKNIRKNIFKATQTEFAALAGVTQATVSRWESGVAPSLEEMQAIRNAANARRDIRWDDSLFFQSRAKPKKRSEAAVEAAE